MRALRRGLPALAAAVCLAVAAVLVLLALDARAWQRAITRDDLRFRAMPSHVGLWHSPAVLPGDPARRLLGLDDALAYRHGLQWFWFGRVGGSVETQTDLPTTRIEAEERLQQVMDGAATAAERSTAANLLGVMTVTTPAKDVTTQAQTLRRAAGYFQRAIGEDPGNVAAKLNLELVFRLREPGKSRFGRDARGGYGFGRGHGVGIVGSGY